MQQFRLFLITLLTLATPITAISAQTGIFEPAKLKPALPGPPDELLILGTPHLSGWPETFKPAALGGLLDKLAAWHPRVIAIEALSGAQCDMLRRYPDRYAETIKDYCWDPAPAQAATGLDVPSATQAVERILSEWPADPAPAFRRRLAALFLASGDQASAVLQWLRLPEAERHAGDGLDAVLVERLSTLQTRRNENFLIAATLAARLGLERVVPMDDHSADTPTPPEAEKAYGAAISKAWDNPATARRATADKMLTSRIASREGVLDLYRAYNAPDQAGLIYESDFGAALVEPSQQMFGRDYVAGWETRNLRMASNIREAMAHEPGARTLVIVGASHKFYLQAYLDQMHAIRLADAEAVLR